MTFEKKIGSSKDVNKMSKKEKKEFPKGLKFTRGNEVLFVKEAFKSDADQWRRVVSESGNEELLMLDILLEDLENGVVSIDFDDKD